MEEQIWWKEENKELPTLYPLIGEFVTTFNHLVEDIEIFVLELINPFKIGYSSRATGTNFNSSYNKSESLIEVFTDETLKAIEYSSAIPTQAIFNDAKNELELIKFNLIYLNKIRNFLVHGFWHDWSSDHAYVNKSIPANSKHNGKIRTSKWGRVSFPFTMEDLEGDIKLIEKLETLIYEFGEKYLRGKGVSLKLSPAREGHIRNSPRYKNWLPWSKRGYKNIGPSTIIWLETINIYSNDALKRFGPEEAYKALLKKGCTASNRLQASLLGSASGERWQDIIKNIK